MAKFVFTFNKAARTKAISAIKKIETGTFVTSVAGAFGADPRSVAIAALVVFVLCRIAEVVIAGIVDTDDKVVKPKPKAGGKKGDGPDTG